MHSLVDTENDSVLTDGATLRRGVDCDPSSKDFREKRSKVRREAASILEPPNLELLQALNLVVRGVHVSYKPRLAARRPEWDAIERDIALLLPAHQPSGSSQEFGFSTNSERRESRAELLLAEPRFLEPAPPRPNWRRPEPSEFNKQREDVSRPFRPRRSLALQARSERPDRGSFRRLASIGGIALGMVLSLGCYHAVFGTTSMADVRAITFMSTLVPKLTASLSNLLPGVFD